MAGTARLTSLGDERYALDLSGEGAALFRHSPAAGWEELARAPLKLGEVTASMASLYKAVRAPNARDVPVEIWLPEEQMIIKPVNTGGVAPVPAMIEHAFATASPDGLAGMVLDQSTRVSGPMHIFAGVPRSVIEETQAFLAPHRFHPACFTRPEEPAGLDHIPVILPPAPARRRSAAGALMAAAMLAVTLGGGAVWWIGVLPGSEQPAQALSLTTEIRQVSVAPDLSPALVRTPGLPAAARPMAAVPQLEAADAVVFDAFVPPQRYKGPVVGTDEITTIRAAALSQAPEVPGALPVPTALRRATPLLAAPGSSPAGPGPQHQQSVAALSAPEAADLRPAVVAAPPAAMPAQNPAPLVAGAARPTAPNLTALRVPAPLPAVGQPPFAPNALAQSDQAAAALSALSPAPGRAFASPLDLPSAPPLTLAAVQNPSAPESPAPDIATAVAEPAAEGEAPDLSEVQILARRPDVVPPLRPVVEALSAPTDPSDTSVEVISARPSVVPPLRAGGNASAQGGAEPELASTSTPLEPSTDDVTADDPARAAAALPEESDPATVATTAPEPEVEGDGEAPTVRVLAERPAIIPPLRPNPEPEPTPPAAANGQQAMDVLDARPDIVPPLRPTPDATQAAESDTASDTTTPEPATTAPETDLIAVLIGEAGEIDLAPLPTAITRRASPPPRPAAMAAAEDARLARLAALAPSELALNSAIAPRRRPQGLSGPSLAAPPSSTGTASPPAAAATAAAPATSTRRVPALPTTASVARAATIDNALPLRQMSLIGVYGKSGNRHALIRLANGRYVKVERGDRVDGFDVAAISADAIRLRKRGRDTLLVIPE